jgi:uncharacterized protein
LTRVFGFILIITIACGLVGGLHYYFWVRLVRDTQLSGTARQIGTAAAIALVGLVVGTPIFSRLVPPVGRVLAWPGYVWIGMMFYLAVLLFGTDVVRLVAWLVGRVSGHVLFDPARRAVSARLLGGVALAGLAGATATAVRATRGRVGVKRVEVWLDRLPAAADGMRIVQMCDLHIGGLLGKNFIEQVVDTCNRLEADAIVVVGDLVDGSVEHLRPAIAPLANLRARHGAFFVTGNHEYYSSSGAGAWMREIEGMGIHVLNNRRLPVGPPDAGFDMAGVPDHTANRFPGEGPGENVADALAGRDPRRAVVLLAHQPIAIHEAAIHGVDLQLSGHTHGGQIWPWGAAVRLQQPYIRGLHRLRDTQIYISCGTGFWGPPMRLGAPAEITEIVLRSTAKSAV